MKRKLQVKSAINKINCQILIIKTIFSSCDWSRLKSKIIRIASDQVDRFEEGWIFRFRSGLIFEASGWGCFLTCPRRLLSTTTTTAPTSCRASSTWSTSRRRRLRFAVAGRRPSASAEPFRRFRCKRSCTCCTRPGELGAGLPTSWPAVVTLEPGPRPSAGSRCAACWASWNFRRRSLWGCRPSTARRTPRTETWKPERRTEHLEDSNYSWPTSWSKTKLVSTWMKAFWFKAESCKFLAQLTNTFPQ